MLKTGDDVEIFNTDTKGQTIFEGYAKLLKHIADGINGVERWIVQFEDGCVCERTAIESPALRKEIHAELPDSRKGAV